ncbi:D-beta-hydroxybutyrate dehydrogenase, partial [Aphelenchoides avenae]
MVLCEAIWTLIALHVLYYIVQKFVGWFKISGLSGKCVLITGCDTGFGRLAVEKCLNEGMIVFAACLHEKSVNELSDKAAAIGGRTVAFTMDVRSDESVQAARDLVESRLARHQGLHAIINNAGIARLGHDDWLPVDDYKENLDVDVLGAVRVVHAFLPLVKKA